MHSKPPDIFSIDRVICVDHNLSEAHPLCRQHSENSFAQVEVIKCKGKSAPNKPNVVDHQEHIKELRSYLRMVGKRSNILLQDVDDRRRELDWQRNLEDQLQKRMSR